MPEPAPAPAPGDEQFFPKGAVAFFVLMTAFFACVWGALYWLMVRHG